MKNKIFSFLLLVFVTVGLIGYFISRPVIQAQDAPQYGSITGNVYYSGFDCHYDTLDHVIVYQFTAGGLVWVAEAPVQFFKDYHYRVTAADLDNQAGDYQLVPDLGSAGGTLGVEPHVRSVSWQPGMIIQNQDFSAIACNHP